MAGEKQALLTAVAAYQPGTPVTADIDAAVKAAGAALEATASVPNLVGAPDLVDGFWVCVFDSRDLLHQAGLGLMSGFAMPDRKVPVRATLQELRPALGFYRNQVTLDADGVPILYSSTADLAIDPAKPNALQVSFKEQAFMPADARYSLAQVRAALGAPDAVPLHSRFAPRGPFPSLVTYVDADLRINRGEAYISVLRRVQ
jgi:hypothetical protein